MAKQATQKAPAKPKGQEPRPVGRPAANQVSTPPIPALQPKAEPMPEVEPEDEAVELAKVLCQGNGENPDNFRMGKPRWEGYLFAARQQIAAFDFLMAARGITEPEVNNGSE